MAVEGPWNSPDKRKQEQPMTNPSCDHCGMPLKNWSDYHPYAACLMFEACHNSETVEANLLAVLAYGAKRSDEPSERQAPAPTPLERDAMPGGWAQHPSFDGNRHCLGRTKDGRDCVLPVRSSQRWEEFKRLAAVQQESIKSPT
jgi:hypothetical protein